MLSVPFRKSEKVRLAHSLIEYLNFNSYDIDEQIQDDLFSLDTSRNKLLNSENLSVDKPYLTYYSNLIQLESKFPFYEDFIKINFEWQAVCSDNEVKETQNHLQFEMASILFNLGALYSNLGASSNLDSESAIRKACEDFQRSAGVFLYLKNKFISNTFDHCLLSIDFQQEILSLLINLMLAQSTETTWYMAMNKGTLKDSNLAKIASEISSAYFKLAMKLDSIPERTHSSFLQHCNKFIESKHHYFALQAEVYMAKVSSLNHQFGESVGRWEKAFHLLFSISHLDEFTFGSLKQNIEDQLSNARKENDIIYLQHIPENLPSIPHAQISMTPISFNSVNSVFLSKLPSYLDHCIFRFDQLALFAMERIHAIQESNNAVECLYGFAGYETLLRKWEELNQADEQANSKLNTLFSDDPIVKDLKTKRIIASKSNRLLLEQLNTKEMTARCLEKLQTLLRKFDTLQNHCDFQKKELISLVTQQARPETMNLFFSQIVDPLFTDPRFGHLTLKPEMVVAEAAEFLQIEEKIDRAMKFFKSLMKTMEGLTSTEERNKTTSNNPFQLGKWDANMPLQFHKGK